MPKTIQSYSMLISCPSDVLEFLPQIEEAVASFNRGYGKQRSIQISTSHWTKNSYSDLEKGKSGQDKLNSQIVDESDMMVGIFWTKFGTPTDRYGSGTEEEIERMLNSGKKVMLFFLDKPISPSKIDTDQLSRVMQFREHIEKNRYGLYSSLENEATIAIKLRDQLEMCFADIMTEEQTPSLDRKRSVLWVDDRPENNASGRIILEEMGIEVITALSTNQAMMWLNKNKVDVIISDMGRKEGNFEGYVLLDRLREKGDRTPFIVFAGSKKPEHVAEVKRRGGQGCTNSFSELISIVTSFILESYTDLE